MASTSKMTKVSRSRFLGLGLSAALLSTGVSPFMAKARTVNFGAATTGRLSDYCRGDGSDETDQINRCLRRYLYVEIDEPPAGVGYGFRSYGPEGGGLILRSGHEISGLGSRSKLLRVGKWQRQGKCFKNDDRLNGNSSIKLNNIYIEGFRNKPDVPNEDSHSDTLGIAIRAIDPDRRCNDIEFTGVQIHNWPGIAIRVRNGWNVTYKDVRVENPARGGVIFNTSKHIHLLGVTSIDSGDDAIAFYVTGYFPKKLASYRPTYDITLDRCNSYTRKDSEYGAALKFWGAREALVTNSTFRRAKNSVIVMNSVASFHPSDIKVKSCKIIGGRKDSLQVVASKASGIEVRGNYMYGPARDCVNITSPDGRARTLSITVANNALVKPGSGRHIYIQENLSGVKTSGNRLLSSDHGPKITDLSPGPGVSIRDRTPTIKATIKDDIANLSKDNIRLYVAGKEVPASEFTYDRDRNRLRYEVPQRLDTGKNSVRIVATDNMGHSTSRSWSFTVDTTKPTISNLSPAPESGVRDRTPTIRATVKDNVTNLSERNIRLYVAGKPISRKKFKYDRAKNRLTYVVPKRMRTGKKTVKVAATDAAGNKTVKRWSFRVRD